MGAKARLERDLTIERQYRAQAERERDRALVEIGRLQAENHKLKARPTLAGRVRNWLDELASALGVGL